MNPLLRNYMISPPWSTSEIMRGHKPLEKIFLNYPLLNSCSVGNKVLLVENILFVSTHVERQTIIFLRPLFSQGDYGDTHYIR